MKLYKEMGRARSKQRQKLLKMRPKEGTLRKLHECLIYRKLVCCHVRGLHLIAGHALDRSAFDCKVYDRSHVTTLNPHGARLEAMAARVTSETRVYMVCAWSLLIRSIASVLDRWLFVRSALDHTGRNSNLHFKSISPLCTSVLHAMTCNINKTLK